MDQVPWIFSYRLQAGLAPRVSIERAPADARSRKVGAAENNYARR
jgi:hypothetical protein